VKTPKRDPDSSFEALLAGALQARAVSEPTDACLDADTLAAWADDTLSARERKAVEAHAADCARCQALMASMVKTAPPVAAATWWRMPALGWLVPAVAVAAALVVWVIVPGPGPIQPSNSVLPSPATVTATTPAMTATAPERPEPDTQSLRREAAPNAAQLKDQPSTPAARKKETTALDKVASPSEPARADSALSTANAQAVAPQPAAPQAGASAAASPPSPSTALMERTFAARVAVPQTVIVSTTPSIRWRIVPGGNVQRSTDGGASWQLQQTGAAETLTAGTSPSPSVCWLVGPRGTVLISTDERSWRRTAFPEATPLVAVSATDDRTATVTAADGRTFRTIDGGATWEPSGGI
jgi:hypothetical protein